MSGLEEVFLRQRTLIIFILFHVVLVLYFLLTDAQRDESSFTSTECLVANLLSRFCYLISHVKERRRRVKWKGKCVPGNRTISDSHFEILTPDEDYIHIERMGEGSGSG